MPAAFYERLGGADSVPAIILSVGIMLMAGFLSTRLTKLLKLPNVTAYILTGVMIGPFCLSLIPAPVIKGMDFISDVALAFIAFSVGEFFRLNTLRENGRRVVIITLAEALFSSLVIFVLTRFVLGLGLAFSAVLAALASATAPASTMMTIRQTGAHGDFVDTLLSAVALDDVVSLVAFSVAISLATASVGGAVAAGDILLPIVFNLLLIAVGFAFGYLLRFMMQKRSDDNRLIVAVALLFGVCGIGAALNVSPLLGCMVMGTVYINLTDDDKLFKQLNYFSPPILLLFFVHSGMNFRIDALFDTGSAVAGVPLIVIGVLYFLFRILGKYAGAWLGCFAVGKDRLVRNYLGLALIPQAGVAIGLVAMAARILGGEDGAVLQTVILASSILYELIGPGCAKLALFLSHSYGGETTGQMPGTENLPPRVESLREQLLQIEAAIADEESSRTEEERAFNEVAGEQYSVSDYMRRNRKFINRR